MVFCTEFLDGWWPWEPLRRSCVRCGWYCARHHPLSRPPPIQKLGAENHTLQLNIQCSWWWAYVPETCRAKNTSIKLPYCIKLAFHFISWGRRTVKQPSKKYTLLSERKTALKSNRTDYPQMCHRNNSENAGLQVFVFHAGAICILCTAIVCKNTGFWLHIEIKSKFPHHQCTVDS